MIDHDLKELEDWSKKRETVGGKIVCCAETKGPKEKNTSCHSVEAWNANSGYKRYCQTSQNQRVIELLS